MWQTQLCPLMQEKLSKVSAFEPATTDMRATLWAILTRFSTTSFGAAPSCFSKPNRIWHRPGWLARKPALTWHWNHILVSIPSVVWELWNHEHDSTTALQFVDALWVSCSYWRWAGNETRLGELLNATNAPRPWRHWQLSGSKTLQALQVWNFTVGCFALFLLSAQDDARRGVFQDPWL